MSELPISEAREHLGEIVAKAERAQERTVLTRHGKAVAAVVPIDDLRALEAAEDEADLAEAREALASVEQRVPVSSSRSSGLPIVVRCTVTCASRTGTAQRSAVRNRISG